MLLQLFLISWYFLNALKTRLILHERVLRLGGVSDHAINGLQPGIGQSSSQRAQQRRESGELQRLTCPGRWMTGRRRAPSFLALCPVQNGGLEKNWPAEETPEPPLLSLTASSALFSGHPAQPGLSVEVSR